MALAGDTVGTKIDKLLPSWSFHAKEEDRLLKQTYRDKLFK